jgi:hypothetical protein
MTRHAATFVWAALLVMPFAFLAVASGAASRTPVPELREPLFWTAVAASALNVALAWRLPPRLGPPRANDRDAVAFTRVLVSIALGEAAAMAPLVAYMLSPDARLLAVAAADVLALALLYPSDRRWAALRPAPEEAGLRAAEVR